MADPAPASVRAADGAPREPAHVRARDLAVTLGRREVLAGVDLDAPAGAITAVLGPNGAGKTTLLRALAGLVPFGGAVHVGGADLAALPRAERARRVAYVPQQSALDAPLSVETVVAHGRYAHAPAGLSGLVGAPTAADRDAVSAAMIATDVADLARRSYLSLSGGERRRVLLARALATGAGAVLLDEPTASLDLGHALALARILAGRAAAGACVVVVMHDLNDALAWTGRAVVLRRGRVFAAGPTAEVLSRDTIRDVWGVDAALEPRLAWKEPAP